MIFIDMITPVKSKGFVFKALNSHSPSIPTKELNIQSENSMLSLLVITIESREKKNKEQRMCDIKEGKNYNQSQPRNEKRNWMKKKTFFTVVVASHSFTNTYTWNISHLHISKCCRHCCCFCCLCVCLKLNETFYLEFYNLHVCIFFGYFFRFVVTF